MEPFPNFGLQAVNCDLNIRYYHQDLHWGRFHQRSPAGFSTTPTPAYSSGLIIKGEGGGMAPPSPSVALTVGYRLKSGLERHPF